MAEYGVGVEIEAPVAGQFAEIVTPEALKFIAGLHRGFNARRKELLAARVERQARLDAGEQPDFLPETRQIRESAWTVADPPRDLLDRRVEIRGPVDRRTIVDALNSGAKVFVADFEDATAPAWENLIEGQIDLRDAVHRTITFEDEDSGNRCELKNETAVLFVRPRGWHMEERHVLVDGEPVSAGIFDFGLYFFHNAQQLLERETGAYFYLSKLESHLDARLWNDIFIAAGQQLDMPAGSIRATVLVDSILAAFEMDEILWELRGHSAGLASSRWDYLSSFIRKFSGNAGMVLPDRTRITRSARFLGSCSKLCVRTCHKRGTSAIGGMNTLVPIENNPAENEPALSAVQANIECEAKDGFDGAAVAHPKLVPAAMEVFNRFMPKPNRIDPSQINIGLSDFNPRARDLLELPSGKITEAGVRLNVEVGLGYVESLLRGTGSVPLCNQMEDASAAEISYAQLWQWVHHRAKLDDSREVTVEFVEETIKAELARVKPIVGMEHYRACMRAAELMRETIRAEACIESLASTAYPRILEREHYPRP